MIESQIASSSVLYRRSDGFAVRSIGGDTLLMPVRSTGTGPDSIYVLNATGSIIWTALAAPAPVKAIVSALVNEFDVTPEQAEADALEYLEELERARVVRREPEEGT
jgi:hypothetical protein